MHPRTLVIANRRVDPLYFDGTRVILASGIRYKYIDFLIRTILSRNKQYFILRTDLLCPTSRQELLYRNTNRHLSVSSTMSVEYNPETAAKFAQDGPEALAEYLRGVRNGHFIVLNEKDVSIADLVCNPVTEQEAENGEFVISAEEADSAVRSAAQANAVVSLKQYLNVMQAGHPFTGRVNEKKIFPAVRVV